MAAAIISVVGSLVSTIATSFLSKKKKDKSAAAREEAAAVGTAQEKNRDRRARRDAIRKERVARARILASAENTGAGGASGALGSVGALRTNTTSAVAAQTSDQKAAEGITALNLKANRLDRQADEISQFGDIFSSAFTAFGKIDFG